MKRQKFLKQLVLLCLVFLTFSCRKMDKVADLKQDENLLAKFLTLPSSTTPEVRRIAAFLERKNAKTGFLNEMAKRHGLALWDKALKTTSKEGSKRIAQRVANVSDTIIYIPLVLENANHVNAFIFARLHDSITLRFYSEKDYASYGFGTIQDSMNNAEKLAVQFMLLDFETFGYSKFKVLDDSLLKDNTLSAAILTKDRKVHIEHSHSSQQNRGNSFELWEYEVCTSTKYWECSSNGNCCSRAGVAPGECSACEGCWKTKTTCTKTSILVSVDDDWFPSGGVTPSGNGGGGGPVGSNPTGPTPCNPTPLLDNGLLPCPRGNTTGWLPLLSPLVGIENFQDLGLNQEDENKVNEWKLNNIKTDSLDPCLTQILEKIWMNNKDGKSVIGTILTKMDKAVNEQNNLEKFQVEYRTVPQLYDIDGNPLSGQTSDDISSDGTVHTTILLNDSIMKVATDLHAARTIIHETIHAYLGSILKRVEAGFTMAQFNAIGYDSSFVKYITFLTNLNPVQLQQLTNPLQNEPSQTEREHSYMANSLVSLIGDELANYDRHQQSNQYYWSLSWASLLRSNKVMKKAWPNFSGDGFTPASGATAPTWPPTNPAPNNNTTYNLPYALTEANLDTIRQALKYERTADPNFAKGKPRLTNGCY